MTTIMINILYPNSQIIYLLVFKYMYVKCIVAHV